MTHYLWLNFSGRQHQHTKLLMISCSAMAHQIVAPEQAVLGSLKPQLIPN